MISMQIALLGRPNNNAIICTIARSTFPASLELGWKLIELNSSYLVSTATANRVKTKFYREDIPLLENVGDNSYSSFTFI